MSSLTVRAPLQVHQKSLRTDNVLHQTYYFKQDHEGSVTHLTDGTGTVIEKYKYDVFGAPTMYNASGATISSSTYGNRFLFTGREYDSTFGIYEYRARAYHPGLGRFMSEDPKGFVRRAGLGKAPDDWSFGTHPDEAEFNLFRYCRNDPLDLTDPTGLDIAIAIGTLRDDWKWIPNPLGHASMAVTSRGTFSEGTGTNQGSAFTRFLGEQQLHRGTTVYVVRTTPEQDKAIAKEAATQHANGELPNVFKHPIDAYKNNCATRVSEAAKAGGVDLGHPRTPGQLQHRLEQKVNKGEATTIPIPQKLKPNVPPILKQFDKL
jgi:RHS repeat-associated protein